MLLVIKGKVDDWRYSRRQAWKIVEGFRGTKDMPPLYDFYSLPYDDELRAEEKTPEESLADWYARASKELENVKWN